MHPRGPIERRQDEEKAERGELGRHLSGQAMGGKMSWRADVGIWGGAA